MWKCNRCQINNQESATECPKCWLMRTTVEVVPSKAEPKEDWPKSKSQIRRLSAQSPESLERWALEMFEELRKETERADRTERMYLGAVKNETRLRANLINLVQACTKGGSIEAPLLDAKATLEGK